MYMRCLPVGPLQANCYLIWDEGLRACAVDPGGEPDRIAGFLSEQGANLEAILVTHGHFDHVEGVKGLFDATGAKVTAPNMLCLCCPALRPAMPPDIPSRRSLSKTSWWSVTGASLAIGSFSCVGHGDPRPHSRAI